MRRHEGLFKFTTTGTKKEPLKAALKSLTGRLQTAWTGPFWMIPENPDNLINAA